MTLTAEALTVRRGGVTVVREVSLTAEPGVLLGLIGPNGAGKTSLLRALSGLDAPDSGRVLYGGVPAGEISRPRFGRMLAFLPQNGRIHWPMQVEHVVALGRLPHGAAKVDAAVERAMAATEILPLRHRAAGSLSGGERARVLLARALAVEAPILLADEPVAALDPYHQLHVMERLRAAADAGALVIAVLHDLTLAARFCDRLLLMAGGVAVAHGPPSDVLNAERLGDVFGVDVRTGRLDGEPYILPWRRRGGVT